MDGLTLVQRAKVAGLRLAVADGRLVVQGPRGAEPIARELLAHKAEILAVLEAAPPPPDPTLAVAPCAACAGIVFWRSFDDLRLHCAACVDCPEARDARWYTTVPADNLLAELADPDARAALSWWYSAGHPEILDDERRILRRVDDAGLVPDVRAELALFIDRVRDVRDAYWRARGLGTA